MQRNFFNTPERIKYLYSKESNKMLHCISFASDKRYMEICEKVLISIKKLYPYCFTKVFLPNDLNETLLNYCKNYPRGYGYWIWKPYIILKTLRSLPLGANVLYLDGRTGLHKDCKEIPWLDKFIESQNFNIGLSKTEHIEYKWTNGDLFELFNIKNDSKDACSFQYYATFMCLKNNIKTQIFVEAWLKILINNGQFCRDEISKNPNHKDFKENRHDQSVLSLLTKHSIKYFNLNVFDIPHPLKVKNPDIVPHYYFRPTTLIKSIKRNLKLLLIKIKIIDKKYTGKYYDGFRI